MILDQLLIIFLQIYFAITSIFFQKQISIGVVGYPESFLPHQVQTDGEKMVSNLVFRKLFKYEEGTLINDLVDSWSNNEDDTLYTIKIKKGLKWQDGKSITADDVLYSITKYENLIGNIEIEKLSDYEISIKLQTPNATLPTLLTIGIEPSHLDGQSSINPIGSTSYRVARITREQDKIESVELISYAENKSYNKIIIKFYGTDNQMLTGYKLSEINTFLSESEFTWDGLKRKQVTFLGRYYGILFNTQNQKLDDADIRQKLSQALNVQSLTERVYFTNSKMAQGPISYSDYTKENFKFPLYNEKVQLTPAQKSKVEKLSILLPNTQDGAQIETFLNEYWGKKLGIQLSYEYLDMDELIDKAENSSFDVVFLGFEVSPDPDRYNFWHSSQIGKLNLARFVDPRSDKSLEEGRKHFTFNDRKEHYDIFQDVMITKTPAVFLYHPGKYLYYSQKFDYSIPEKIFYPSDIVKNF